MVSKYGWLQDKICFNQHSFQLDEITKDVTLKDVLYYYYLLCQDYFKILTSPILFDFHSLANPNGEQLNVIMFIFGLEQCSHCIEQ